jgi:hypothetical protein
MIYLWIFKFDAIDFLGTILIEKIYFFNSIFQNSQINFKPYIKAFNW